MLTRIGNTWATVFGPHKYEVTESRIFKDWCESLEKGFKVRDVEIQSVDFVERDGEKKILFIKFKADIYDAEGNSLPGIVFLRGHSVGMLVVLECEGQEHIVLVNQARPAIGKLSYPELPAGMIDDGSDRISSVIKETKEEIGIIAEEKDVFRLSGNFFGGKWSMLHPSPGACDEGVEIFLIRKQVSKNELDSFMEKETGSIEEGEKIKLSILKIEEVCMATPCALAHSALMMYSSLRQKGEIP